MTFRDLLLHIDSYPDPTPEPAIDAAVRLAARLGSAITALAVQVAIPLRTNRIADLLVHLGELAQAEEARSLAACRSGLACFEGLAAGAGLAHATLLERANLYDVAARVTAHARTRDACLIPFAAGPDGQVHVAHSVIFESGRPAILLPQAARVGPATELGEVVLAWDGGASAARAMADALPVLRRAGRTRVLTVLNEKPQAVAAMGAEVVRHLAAHGVSAEVVEIDGAGRSIGESLDAYVQDHAPDLLVMGAYGHSRLREFVLGGATDHVLHGPSVPVLMSH
jgi:nucleotide-binding universal stress UspA family protein